MRCPFYKYDDGKKRITCEGLTDDSSLALIYHNKTDYEKQISISVPIRPRRCDHLRLRVVGEGEAKIYSIAKVVEEGSDD